jgi:hypothetical protein
MEASPAFVAHEQRSGHEEAYKNFIANSKLHIWALNDGVRFFVRCVVNAADPHAGDDWPRVFAEGESRPVNCAIFTQNDEDRTFELIAVWAHSLGMHSNFSFPSL